MKRVLLISAIPFQPASAGNRVVINSLVQNLKNIGCVIDFLHYDTNSNQKCDYKRMKKLIYPGDYFLIKHLHRRDGVVSQIRDVLSVSPLKKKVTIKYHIDDWYDEQISQKAKELHEKHHYDIVWVEYVMYSKVLTCFDDSVTKVIEAHDIFTDREKMFLKMGEVPSFFYTSRKEERKGLSRADYVVAIQNRDASFFKKLVGDKSIIVTIRTIIKVNQPSLVHNKTVLFVGTDYAPNREGIRYFLEEVWSKVKVKLPEAELHIAGSVCQNLKKSNQYTLLGYVDSIDDVYAQSRLVINPVLSGTGLNIKTIEALAHAKPLVTTKSGARGLQYKKGFMEVANDSEEFANMIIRVLTNDLCALELSKNAAKFVQYYNRRSEENLKKILFSSR